MSLSVQCTSCCRCGSPMLDAVNGVFCGALRSHIESGGRIYTTAWWTLPRLDGRISDIRTHLSSVNPVGTISYVYSTSPRAGIATAFGICTTRSGFGMFQSSVHALGGGASRGSPAGAPLSAHVVIVSICSAVSDGSLEKWPYFGSANHGGIF